MRLIPIHKEEAEKGSFFSYVFYVFGIIAGCIAFGYTMYLANHAAPFNRTDDSLATLVVFVGGILAGLLAAFIPCCIGWALSILRSIRWNTAGYYIEYDTEENQEAAKNDANVQPEEHQDSQTA